MQFLQSVATAVVLGLTLPSVLSRVFNVEVGPDQAFHPPFISAARRGDSIAFQFKLSATALHSRQSASLANTYKPGTALIQELANSLGQLSQLQCRMLGQSMPSALLEMIVTKEWCSR